MYNNKKWEMGDVVKVTCTELPFHNYVGVILGRVGRGKYLVFLSPLGNLPLWRKHLTLLATGRKEVKIPAAFVNAFKLEDLENATPPALEDIDKVHGDEDLADGEEE